MFGQDDTQQQGGGQDWQQPNDQVQGSQPIQDEHGAYDTGDNVVAPVAPEPMQAPSPVAPAQDWQQPQPAAEPVATAWAEPAAEQPVVATEPVQATTPGDDLLDIKQKALTELSPLVGHLDQTPEEKFKTTMMMIQASDNQALIPEAYASAQDITDEKAKAQALLDIVNEINYFTQHQN